MSVNMEQTKFYKEQLQKDSLSTNLFDITLKLCLCQISSVGENTKLQQHQVSRLYEFNLRKQSVLVVCYAKNQAVKNYKRQFAYKGTLTYTNYIYLFH